uniref:TM2 domain-containing protein n=1 Tax=Pricia sp. TaxID=2268138 RepID=UPI003593F9D7
MSDENKKFGEGSEGSFDKENKKSSGFGNKAKGEFEKAKESTKDFADDTKKAANEFGEGAKRTANEFSEGARGAFAGGGNENKKILAGILAIVLGSLGIHKFILGYQKEGIILLVATVIGYVLMCVGIGFFFVMATGLVGLIEGIIYLTKTDEEFYNT